MASYNDIAERIIKEQELVIGPVAWNEARKVSGLQIIGNKIDINNSSGDPKSVIDRLISQYENIFGRASREVCREAVAALVADMPMSDIPTSLR